MDRMTGGEALVRALADSGVEIVFGIPGVHNLPIYDALARETRVRHVLARHEQGAAFMADGYARATGRPGVVITTSGPAALNALTPLATAYADFSPVLCISSQVESFQIHNGRAPFRGVLHEMKDQLGAMSAATGWSARPATPSAITGAVRAALEHLQAGRPTPAYIEAPFDVLSAETRYVAPPAFGEQVTTVNEAQIRRFAEVLRSARRPLILAGDAVARADASGVLTKLAERLGAPVLTDTAGKGSIPEDHPLSMGRTPRSQNSELAEAVAESDVALVVGCIVPGKESDSWAPPLPPMTLQIDPDIEQIGLAQPAALGLVGDPKVALDRLLAELKDLNRSPDGADRAGRARRVMVEALRSQRGDLLLYLDAIRAALPPEGILCADMTMMAYAAQTHYPALRPRTFLMPSGFGTLGFALPAAVGAKIGKPDTPLVALAGEGGLQFTLQELATARQFGAAFPLVVFNDHTYTAVKRAQRDAYEGRYIAVDLQDPDLGKLADAYGVRYECTQDPWELETLLRKGLTADRLTLIEVPVEVEGW